MVDITITAASVEPNSGAKKVTGTAGASITAGQVVYLDGTDSKYKLADNNSATSAVRSPAGIAMHSAEDGQPLTIVSKGSIDIGATVTAGVAYYLSDTPGGICPVADLLTGEYPVFLGFATTAAILDVNIIESGVALA